MRDHQSVQEQAQRARKKENPAPVPLGDDERDAGRRDHGADGGARVDDSHGGGTLVHGEPLGDGLRRRGKTAALAHPEQKAAGGKHAEAGGQAVTRAGE